MSRATKNPKLFDVISKMTKPVPEHLHVLFRRGCLIHRNHMNKLTERNSMSAMIRATAVDSSTMSTLNVGLLGLLNSNRQSKLLIKVTYTTVTEMAS